MIAALIVLAGLVLVTLLLCVAVAVLNRISLSLATIAGCYLAWLDTQGDEAKSAVAQIKAAIEQYDE